MPQLKVGLIGGGGIASAHIEGYREHAGKIGITAVADAVEKTAAARGEELGATPYTDYLQMLEAEELDAVDICLPHHLHRDAIVAAAQAGKHVLCEKPLCLSGEEAADVRAAVTGNGVTLMCAHNQLFMPAVAKAKELLDAGTIGTVYEDQLGVPAGPRYRALLRRRRAGIPAQRRQLAGLAAPVRGDGDLRAGARRHLRRRDRPLRRLADRQDPAAAHRGGGHRRPRHPARRLRGLPHQDHRPDQMTTMAVTPRAIPTR
ncbi:Gfo/Idh/MocA family oxidoreductase [Streptomyces sp. SID13031]|uniref:Gfo/Idh/MocA family protein n=1 Tax=Streptomyces sp. SID13031 TaxID=2706046 RepID=UPI0019448161|nr:Gfo/Idh/MocA family oxidoreductase [Streptomyces sp. SID13031]